MRELTVEERTQVQAQRQSPQRVSYAAVVRRGLMWGIPADCQDENWRRLRCMLRLHHPDAGTLAPLANRAYKPRANHVAFRAS